MNAAVVQTLWARTLVGALADAGVRLCVLSPGSRSTPLALALALEPRVDVVAIIDERAAAFYALGAARATGAPAAIVCTSGTAAAHYLPAIVEAAAAGMPLIAVTADRPPELHDCGANQTIAQRGLYGTFPRGAFELGTPEGSALAFRALRRKVAHAVALARGPRPGPVHLDVPLRKPLEPAEPASDAERAFAREVAGDATPLAASPSPIADPAAVAALVAAIAAEPHGAIVVGAMPLEFARARRAVFALAARTGYPIVAEAGSQLRYGPRPDGVVVVEHLELLLAARLAPDPRLIVQLGAEPVAAGWTGLRGERWVIAGEWRDPDSTARAIVVGDPASTLGAVIDALGAAAPGASRTHADAWLAADRRAAAALARATAEAPLSEVAIVRAVLAALPPAALLQLGNSLPVRVVEHCPGGGDLRRVVTQRGASGIDGLVASAAGATHADAPVALVLGDVSFAHDAGALLAARRPRAPLAIVVVDNGGGRIFDALPVAAAEIGESLASAASPGEAEQRSDLPKPDVYARMFLTAPELDVVAVARAYGARAEVVRSPDEAARAVATALELRTVTVVHAQVTPTGARDVVRSTVDLLSAPPDGGGAARPGEAGAFAHLRGPS